MAHVYAHSNVYTSCLAILEQKGYQIKVYDDNDAYLWEANLGNYRFLAHNPVELLGLVGIYEFKEMPKEEGVSYWWVVKGEKSYTDYTETSTPFGNDGDED